MRLSVCLRRSALSLPLLSRVSEDSIFSFTIYVLAVSCGLVFRTGGDSEVKCLQVYEEVPSAYFELKRRAQGVPPLLSEGSWNRLGAPPATPARGIKR